MEQREITFRGKRKETGEWIYGDLIQWTNQNRCAITPQDGDQWDNPNDYEVDPSTVGQYTGLKDKNGKEIYEGDVITPNHQFNFVVEWWGSGWYAVNGGDHTMLKVITNVEVVGNIYENPELLNP